MSEEKEDKSKVNEPSADYSKSEIRFFKSFEEMNEDQYEYWRRLTPAERLAGHYEMIAGIYNYKDTFTLYDRIYFHE